MYGVVLDNASQEWHKDELLQNETTLHEITLVLGELFSLILKREIRNEISWLDRATRARWASDEYNFYIITSTELFWLLAIKSDLLLFDGRNYANDEWVLPLVQLRAPCNVGSRSFNMLLNGVPFHCRCGRNLILKMG